MFCLQSTVFHWRRQLKPPPSGWLHDTIDTQQIIHLYSIVQRWQTFMTFYNLVSKSILCLYSDSGPDHRLTYLSVKVALICLFIFVDLDYLIAAQTAPQHSWCNPSKKVMSTLNLGLQCIGLEQHAGDERFEGEVKDRNTIKDL